MRRNFLFQDTNPSNPANFLVTEKNFEENYEKYFDELHTAARCDQILVINRLKNSLSKSQFLKLLHHNPSSNSSSPIIHQMASYNRSAAIQTLVVHLSIEERLSIFLLPHGRSKRTSLHFAASTNEANNSGCSFETASKIKELLYSPNDHTFWLKLLSAQAEDLDTPVHYAARLYEAKLLNLLSTDLPAVEWLNILSIKNKSGRTALEVYLINNNRKIDGSQKEFIAAFRARLTDSEWLNFLLSNKLLDKQFNHDSKMNQYLFQHMVGDLPLLTDKNQITNFKTTNNDIICSLLFRACKKGNYLLAEKLIVSGAPINANSASRLNMTPLMIASLEGHEDIVDLLLKNQADLFSTSEFNSTALMLANTKKILVMILKKAKDDGCFEQLLLMRDKNSLTVFERAMENGNLSVVKELMLIENWEKYANLPLFLHYARLASWEDPVHYEKHDQICSIIKSKMSTIGHPVLELHTHLSSQSFEESYQILFGDGDCHQHVVDSEESALKIILAEAYSLLATPEKCFKYLTFLNNELIRYFKETYGEPLPTVDPNTFTMKIIDGVYYPIPNHSYNSNLEKHSALPQLLILLFQKKYGLANKAFRWIGFIPHEIADQMVIDGDFFKENIGPGLFHGSLSHMLQQAILLYAVENGDIHVDYIIAGEKKRFSLKEILAAFIRMKVWGDLRDERNFLEIAFSDPHRLISIIMHDGHKLGYPALADYLTDSHCKGYLKLLKALETISPKLKQEPEAFAEQMNELFSPEFRTPKKLINYAIQREEDKGLLSGAQISKENYAAIPISYKIDNPKFEPGHYHDDAISAAPQQSMRAKN
jgi:ankyrin repeat protein